MQIYLVKSKCEKIVEARNTFLEKVKSLEIEGYSQNCCDINSIEEKLLRNANRDCIEKVKTKIMQIPIAEGDSDSFNLSDFAFDALLTNYFLEIREYARKITCLEKPLVEYKRTVMNILMKD